MCACDAVATVTTLDAMSREDVLERHEDRLVGRPVAERVDVDLELRPPGRDERLLLGAEVVVERPHGHVGGRRDVVGRDRVQSSLESEAQDGLAEGCARFCLLALAETGGFLHDHTIAERAEACKFARACMSQPSGVSRAIGMIRSVFDGYSAKPGNSATCRSQSVSRSAPSATEARAWKV